MTRTPPESERLPRSITGMEADHPTPSISMADNESGRGARARQKDGHMANSAAYVALRDDTVTLQNGLDNSTGS